MMSPWRYVALACFAVAPVRARSQQAEADFVFRGGTVYTADSSHPHATAAAVAGTKIVFVGDDSGAALFIGPRTTVVELTGKTLLPGFQDSHLHPISGGMALADCVLDDDSTRAMLEARIRKCAKEHPGSGWLRGRGWALPIFAAANPSRQLLDSLVPGRPVFLRAADGHSAWVNSRALAIAGITAATPDPPRGRIERDAAGAPSGTLREAAVSLVSAHLPPRTPAEYRRGLLAAMKLANSLGITSLQDASVDSSDLMTYAALEREHALTVRVVAAILVDPAGGVAQVKHMEKWRARYLSAHVRPISAKIFADGVIESGTAALLDPYVGTKSLGPTEIAPPTMDSIVIALDRAGFHVHVHAIGDRAVREALDAFAAARAANGPRDSRHQIAHLEMIDAKDIPRFAQLGVLANFQALWAYRDSYIRDLTEPVLGPERSARLYPMGEVRRAGGTIVGGSDWNVSSMDPLQAIQVGVTRRDPDGPPGDPWLPNEAVTLDVMLEAYTIQGARANFQERTTGSITVGKAADLIVLDRDLDTIAATEVHKARVILTLFDGRPVYRAASH